MKEKLGSEQRDISGASWNEVMEMGAKPKLGGQVIELDGDYYRVITEERYAYGDDEDDGREDVVGFEKITAEEYQAAKKQSRQENREYVRSEILRVFGRKSAEEKKYDEERKAVNASKMEHASYASAMDMGAKPRISGYVELDGRYYREKGTVEDGDGNEDVSGWVEVTEEEYRAAKKERRRDSVKLVRDTFKKLFKGRKNGEN